MTGDEKANETGAMTVDNVSEIRSTSVDNQVDGSSVEKMKLRQLGNDTTVDGLKNFLQSGNDNINGSLGQLKQEEGLPQGENGGTRFSNLNQASIGACIHAKLDNCKANLMVKDIHESLVQTNLSITLGAPSGNQNMFPSAVVEDREQNKASTPIQQGPRSRHLLPKPPRSALSPGLETNTGIVPQIRVARPPAEGRGRNQLLPRYWPRITDQELQQISGEYPCLYHFFV